MEEPGGNGAVVRAGRCSGGGWAAAVRRGVKERGRKGTGPRASIWLYRALTGGASQTRPDRWRGKACHVNDQRARDVAMYALLPRRHT